MTTPERPACRECGGDLWTVRNDPNRCTCEAEALTLGEALERDPENPYLRALVEEGL